MPNQLDFDVVFTEITQIHETGNVAVLCTIIAALLLYLLVCIFARKADNKDQAKVKKKQFALFYISTHFVMKLCSVFHTFLFICSLKCLPAWIAGWCGNGYCSVQLLLAEQITRIHPGKHLIRKNILQISNLCVSERFEGIMLSSTMAGTKQNSGKTKFSKADGENCARTISSLR